MSSEFIFIALIIFAASFTMGFSGFGFGLMSVPVISLIAGVKYAVPLAALSGLVINIYLLITFREHMRIKYLKNLYIGASLGIPIGAYLLFHIETHILKVALGLLVFLFSIFSLFKIIRPIGLRRTWGLAAGLFSGIFGGAFNTNGPPVIIYFFLQGLDKNELKASITGYFIFTSILIVTFHAISGITTMQITLDFLKLLPFILIGMYSGSKLFGKVSTEIFQKVLLTFLLIVSIVLIFD